MDLIQVFKIICNIDDIQMDRLFELSDSQTHGHNKYDIHGGSKIPNWRYLLKSLPYICNIYINMDIFADQITRLK